MGQRRECLDPEFLARVFSKLNTMLTEAYHITPEHIASKALLERALWLVRSLLICLSGGDREVAGDP